MRRKWMRTLFSSGATLSGVALLGVWMAMLVVFLTCEGPISPPRRDSPSQVVNSHRPLATTFGICRLGNATQELQGS
jgi:hypothetical protein